MKEKIFILLSLITILIIPMRTKASDWKDVKDLIKSDFSCKYVMDENIKEVVRDENGLYSRMNDIFSPNDFTIHVKSDGIYFSAEGGKEKLIIGASGGDNYIEMYNEHVTYIFFEYYDFDKFIEFYNNNGYCVEELKPGDQNEDGFITLYWETGFGLTITYYNEVSTDNDGNPNETTVCSGHCKLNNATYCATSCKQYEPTVGDRDEITSAYIELGRVKHKASGKEEKYFCIKLVAYSGVIFNGVDGCHIIDENYVETIANYNDMDIRLYTSDIPNLFIGSDKYSDRVYFTYATWHPATSSYYITSYENSGEGYESSEDGAGEDYANPEEEEKEESGTKDDGEVSCSFLWGDPDEPNDPAYWVQWALDLIKYAAIIALLLLSTIDFVKAFISQDRDAINHALTTSAKRAIFAVMIFFLPILVELIMTLFGAYGTCGFE